MREVWGTLGNGFSGRNSRNLKGKTRFVRFRVGLFSKWSDTNGLGPYMAMDHGKEGSSRESSNHRLAYQAGRINASTLRSVAPHTRALLSGPPGLVESSYHTLLRFLTSFILSVVVLCRCFGIETRKVRGNSRKTLEI